MHFLILTGRAGLAVGRAHVRVAGVERRKIRREWLEMEMEMAMGRESEGSLQWGRCEDGFMGI